MELQIRVESMIIYIKLRWKLLIIFSRCEMYIYIYIPGIPQKVIVAQPSKTLLYKLQHFIHIYQSNKLVITLEHKSIQALEKSTLLYGE